MDRPSPRELRRLAEELLDERSTMSIATARGDSPWIAPVYYALVHGRFYFFSAPDSRHVVEALASGRVAASVHAESDSWRGIRGAQMTGAIREVTRKLELAEAFIRYVRRYPFVRELLPQGAENDPGAFFQRFRVKLYCFEPDLVYYLDNGIGFGFREEVALRD